MAGLFSLLVGRTLRGRYRVERLISKGGMGAVFLGADGELGRQVAIKVIAMEPQSPEEEASLRARFRREARAAARLQHPNVVTIYDVGSDEETGLDFIVMELLTGEDIQQRLRRAGPLPLPLALEVLHGAACGLGAGHRQGLVHRDVKPANLFLEEAAAGHPPRVRVLDFGIAQVLENSGATVTKLTIYGGGPLSPPYAAPEQLRGSGELTPACDVWALGCTAFELLTGVPPFGEAERERMRRGEPVRPPRLVLATDPMGQVEAFVHRTLLPSPQDRPQDGDAVAAKVADLSRAISAADHVAYRTPRLAAPYRGRRTEASGGQPSVPAPLSRESPAETNGATRVAPRLAVGADDHASSSVPERPIARTSNPRTRRIGGVAAGILGIMMLAVAPWVIPLLPRPGPATPKGAARLYRAPDGTHYVEVRQATTKDGASGSFEPSVVYVNRGNVLRFVTDGKTAHNVSFKPSTDVPSAKLPPSGPYLTARGQSYDVPIDFPPGTYTFQCDPHEHGGEVGMLIVS